jgi:hypothetical protein
MFHQFIQGVTFFQHQAGIQVPIYHRVNACGPWDHAFREAFQRCSEDMEEDRLEDVKKRIETCYIERLVYDEIYHGYTLHFPKRGDDIHGQDEGHMHRLQVTKEDFATCFPHLDLEVSMEWDMGFPMHLKITRRSHGKVSSTETYQRSMTIMEPFGTRVYDPTVECIRETQQKRYYRTQRFDYLPKWKEI